MKKQIIAAIFAFTTVSAHAEHVNYKGVVNRVSLLQADGSFVVTVDSGVLDDCLYKYAYFMVDKIGLERTRMAYSMVMTSLATNMTMNFVIDKNAKGSGGQCYVGNMVSGIQSW